MTEAEKSIEDTIQGVGCARKRKEDPRFIQGKGTYVDDIKMQGMLFMDVVRSPYAHARIKGINKENALALPGVHAVLTADDLKPLNLHWMPTLAGDVQAVLADAITLFWGFSTISSLPNIFYCSATHSFPSLFPSRSFGSTASLL